jgi:hypothetical protein
MKISRRDQLKIFGGGMLALGIGLGAIVVVLIALSLLVR